MALLWDTFCKDMTVISHESSAFATAQPKRMMLEAEMLFENNNTMLVSYGYASSEVCHGCQMT
jgi:hypothetical protein